MRAGWCAGLALHPARVYAAGAIMAARHSSHGPPLRTTLRRLLALSLAAPFATAAACRATTDTPSPPIDAASDPTGDAASPSPDASSEASSPVDASVDDASACRPVPVEAGFFGEDGSCASFVYLPCGHSIPLPDSGCVPVSVDLCVAVCPEHFFTTCTFPAPTCAGDFVDPDAAIYLDCSTCLGNIGRRPVGLLSPRRVPRGRGGGTALGRYFALAAYLERASVDAFVQLHARLVSFGAPARLARAALRAAGDERRHARATARLARRFGSEVDEAGPCADVPLSFEEFALENAVEGCVRETFGALVSMHQRERAKDARIARAMRRVSDDEARHAELAWAIHRWATPKLSPAAGQRIRCAQARALNELRVVAGIWPPEVIRDAGMPEPALHARLAGDFARILFGAGAEGRAGCPGSRQRGALGRRNPAPFSSSGGFRAARS
jgi:hypothetical protein